MEKIGSFIVIGSSSKGYQQLKKEPFGPMVPLRIDVLDVRQIFKPTCLLHAIWPFSNAGECVNQRACPLANGRVTTGRTVHVYSSLKKFLHIKTI